jgi:hypothetical protein
MDRARHAMTLFNDAASWRSLAHGLAAMHAWDLREKRIAHASAAGVRRDDHIPAALTRHMMTDSHAPRSLAGNAYRSMRGATRAAAPPRRRVDDRGNRGDCKCTRTASAPQPRGYRTTTCVCGSTRK